MKTASAIAGGPFARGVARGAEGGPTERWTHLQR